MENGGGDVEMEMPAIASPRAGLSARSVGVCGCCVVWEVTRGPHAGERAKFASRETPCATLGVGRRAQCWLRLRKDLEVSGLHAQLEAAADGGSLRLRLRDCRSTNGTRINGRAAAGGELYAVEDQDLLQFGRSTVRVRLGDTQCPRARGDGDRGVGTTEAETVAQPAAEPEPTQAKASDREDEAGAANEHEDEHAFEERAPASVQTSPAPPRGQRCMVCGQELSAWSVLEQHLHVNACLDQRVTPPLQPPRRTPSNASAAGRKRKRTAQTTLRKPEDEELAVALALSKSLVDPEQQVDMELALVAGELAQLDAQLKKLQKKRVVLVRKMEKLDKAKRKVHKSQVRAPHETRALLDVETALRVLFPETRKATNSSRDAEQEKQKEDVRPGAARLMVAYRSAMATSRGAGEYVTMWRRCAQRRHCGEDEDQDGDDDALYTNELAWRWHARAETEKAAVAASRQADAAATEEQLKLDAQEPNNDGVHNPQVDKLAVPEVVKRVFPNWQENLAFLETQSLRDLKTALDEMRRLRAAKRADARVNNQISDAQDGQTSRDDGFDAADGSGEPEPTTTRRREEAEKQGEDDDEAWACLFFEEEMERLIRQHQELNSEGSLADVEVEIVELTSSQDDDNADTNEDGDRPSFAGGDAVPAARTSPSIVLIEDSSDEEMATAETSEATESPQCATPEPEDDVPSEREQELSDGKEDALTSPATSGAGETATLGRQQHAPTHSKPVDGHDTEPSPLDAATRSTTALDLEQQLLAAIKANEKLYEAVLLLQPLDLQQLHQYVRDDAGIKCTKSALVRFCDRHGITFKSS